MEINSLTVNDLTREHSKKCEGRKGIQKREHGTENPSTVKLFGVLQLGFCSEIRGFCHFEDIILSVGVPVSDPQNVR